MVRDHKSSIDFIDKERMLVLSKEFSGKPQSKVINAFLLLADRVPMGEIARQVGVHRSTLSRWISAYLHEGTDAFRRFPPSGRPPKITQSHIGQIQQIATTPPCQLGKLFHKWTPQRLSRHFSMQTGISITPHYLALLLKRSGISLDRVNSPKFHVKKQVFTPQADGDEFAEIPSQQVVWAIVGSLSEDDTKFKSKPKRVVYVAFEIRTGKRIIHFARKINMPETILFIQKILVGFRPHPILLLYDDVEIFEGRTIINYVSKVKDFIEFRPLHLPSHLGSSVPRTWEKSCLVRCHRHLISEVDKFAENAQQFANDLHSILSAG